MSVICPICEGKVDWAEEKCPHSIDDIVETLYLEIKGLEHVYDDQTTGLRYENDTLRTERDNYQESVGNLATACKELIIERDALRKQLEIAVREIRIPIDNPKSYGTEVIAWSKYLLAKIEKVGEK